MSWIPFLLQVVLWGFFLAELVTGRLWGPGGMGKIARSKSPIAYWGLVAVSAVAVWWLSQLLASPTVLSALTAFTTALPSVNDVSQRVSELNQQAAVMNAVVVDSACPVALDAGYGYDPANPVRIGGGEFGGPLRTSAYLQNIQGPNGEKVSYTLEVWVSVSGATLNTFTVTYPGPAEPKTLYFDHATYVELKAPSGFRCGQPFSISAP